MLIGSLSPAIATTVDVHPATAETTARARIGPASVSTPTQAPSCVVIPVTPSPSWTWTPSLVAAEANPHTT